MGRRIALVGCSVALACASDPTEAPSDTEGGTTSVIIEPEGSSAAESSSGGEPIPDTRRCIPPEGVDAAPRTIADAVTLLNALPAPVDIPCFLESLDRPLKIHATTSTFSAQPAYDAENPRVFLFAGDLVMSVVPAGEGADLLEFGEFVDDFQTLKGEVQLPLSGTLAPADPFERIRFQNGTGCGLCHHNEHEVGTLDGVSQFASLAFQPALNHDLAEEDVRAARDACEGQDTERCRILRALFDHGVVLFTEFPEDLPSFGG